MWPLCLRSFWSYHRTDSVCTLSSSIKHHHYQLFLALTLLEWESRGFEFDSTSRSRFSTGYWVFLEKPWPVIFFLFPFPPCLPLAWCTVLVQWGTGGFAGTAPDAWLIPLSRGQIWIYKKWSMNFFSLAQMFHSGVKQRSSHLKWEDTTRVLFFFWMLVVDFQNRLKSRVCFVYIN